MKRLEDFLKSGLAAQRAVDKAVAMNEQRVRAQILTRLLEARRLLEDLALEHPEIYESLRQRAHDLVADLMDPEGRARAIAKMLEDRS